MATRKPGPSLAERTSIAEWIAAGLGFLVTAGVIGYTLWEGVSERDGPPRLTVVSEQVKSSPQGYVVPIVIHNASHATAADVEVLGVVSHGAHVEARRARFAYVPGLGEARGGLVFQADPGMSKIVLSVEGYADP